MSLIKFIFWFLLRFVLVYGLLNALWFSVDKFYAKNFITAGNMVFSSFGSKGEVRFFAFQSPKSPHRDIAILLVNRETVDSDKLDEKEIPVHWFIISSRDMGYTLTILLIALILATPIRWKRKGWTLLWGMIFVHVFLVFKLTILFLFSFSNGEPPAVMAFSPFWQSILNVTHEIVMVNIGFFYIALVIWILVTFRRSDWRMLEQMLPKTR